MEYDDLDLTPEETLRLLEDAGRVPQEPLGSHLDGEDRFDLTHGLMSQSRRQAALAHLESCRACAEDAVRLAHSHELEDEATAAAALSAAKYANAIEQQVTTAAALAGLWMVARRHAVCMARSQRLRATRSLQTRSEWRQFEGNSKLFCAIRESAAGRTFALRSTDRAWAGRPILCRISRIGEADALVPWAVVWAMLPVPKNADPTEFIGIVRLNVDEATPPEWRADVDLCELDARQMPDLRLLRQAVDAAARDSDREAWREWVASEVAGGRLPPDVTAKLFPR